MKISDTEFKLLKQLIEEHCGILLGDEKKYLVENRLSELVRKIGCQNFLDFYYKVKHSSSKPWLNTLVDNIVTKETFWFRNETHFNVIKEKVLPELSLKIKNGKDKKLRIWSAACSTGQESYSLAITILEFLRTNNILPLDNIEIIATDISAEVIEFAKKGVYGSIYIKRGLPTEYLERYFIKQDKFWKVNQKLSNLINFKVINLINNISHLGSFDIVFLKNIIIYLGKKYKERLLKEVLKMVKPGGYLFMGAGENLERHNIDFKILQKNGIIYYQKELT